MSQALVDGGYWSLAQTLAGRETYAAKNLEQRGYEILNLKCRQHIGRKSRIVALFPGYLLVKIVDHFWSARRAIGVIDLLMDFERPARLPQAEFERITANFDPRTGLVRLPKRSKAQHTTALEFERGDNVRILTGKFCGFDAIYDGMSSHERICVLLDMFGRRSHVELAPDDQVAAIASQ